MGDIEDLEREIQTIRSYFDLIPKGNCLVQIFPGTSVILRNGTLTGINGLGQIEDFNYSPNYPITLSYTDGVLTALGRTFLPSIDGNSWMEVRVL